MPGKRGMFFYTIVIAEIPPGYFLSPVVKSTHERKLKPRELLEIKWSSFSWLSWRRCQRQINLLCRRGFFKMVWNQDVTVCKLASSGCVFVWHSWRKHGRTTKDTFEIHWIRNCIQNWFKLDLKHLATLEIEHDSWTCHSKLKQAFSSSYTSLTCGPQSLSLNFIQFWLRGNNFI